MKTSSLNVTMTIHVSRLFLVIDRAQSIQPLHIDVYISFATDITIDYDHLS